MPYPFEREEKGVAGAFIVNEISKNEECPDTFRHLGYYEKIYLMCNKKHYVKRFLNCKISITINCE